MKIVLALDPATYTTGYAIFKVVKEETKLIKYGYFEIPKDMKYPERMYLLREKTLLLIDKAKPTHLVIEAPFLGPNPQTFKLLSGGYGILCGISHERGLPLIAMPPTEAKIHLLGTSRMKGAISKKKIKDLLEPFFNVKFTKLDESDAVATGVTAIDKYIIKGIDIHY